MTVRRLQTVRHGLTTANLAKVCGSPDDELAEQGRRQAGEARARFAGTELGRVISSPMARAVATATHVTGLEGAGLELDDGCRERDFGSLSGLTHEQAVARFPQVDYLVVQAVPYSVNPPGGETLDALRERAGRFLQALHRSFDGEVVTVFSHGNFLQQLRAAVHGVDALAALELPLEGILNLALMRFDFADHGALARHSVTQLAPTDGVRGLY
ncbi:MAG: ribonuclease / adenosylcobalamin/alpha-ribazole phosphatase [Solirubrobacteraceae bacterium]